MRWVVPVLMTMLGLTACGGSFGEYNRMAVLAEELDPQFETRLRSAEVVYVRELFVWTLSFPPEPTLIWQSYEARWRNDFAHRLEVYWREQKVAARLVMLPDDAPDPPGLVVRPVVHAVMTVDGGWSYATVDIVDGVTGGEVYFARVDLPAVVGRFESRRLFPREGSAYDQAIANAHLAWALPALMRTGVLPRPGIGRPSTWPLGQYVAAEAESFYWRDRMRALPEGASPAQRYLERAADAVVRQAALLDELSASCRHGGALTDVCVSAESRRLGREVSR
ncbi:MAG: hypothetical protein KC635_20750 [Myxococcales bacterium]|nr:hypothetical protein [Myxococcales bacterium]MCA9557777.1 hypothetical protein [Myxococcales bacterium]MCB9736870.1 hypothetical protein [Deltaproteobacteria bacterium]